jgi:geranylgeranyl diphosphate synthase type I
VAGSTRLVDLVQQRIDDSVSEHATALAEISPDLGVLAETASDFLSGGKRFRALFCYWGWQAVAAVGHDDDADAGAAEQAHSLPAVVTVAAALELFHAAALVHDDIMDNSDLRRGAAAAHKRFESLHERQGWDGDRAAFGASSALLLGDLLLAWSDELFDDGCRRLPDRTSGEAARSEFARMRTEVIVGQYLDILEEASWRSRPDSELLSRAHRVILYKSAKYSVESPLVIGGSLAGASLDQLVALREFGLPLGVAFQLRDDLLGVFGDPEVTGKPAGDDLREGKRTVLIGLARQKMPGSATRLLDELLGDPDLDDGQIDMLQSTIRESGAVDQIERIIAREVERARDSLNDAPLGRTAREELRTLADTVTRRNS